VNAVDDGKDVVRRLLPGEVDRTVVRRVGAHAGGRGRRRAVAAAVDRKLVDPDLRRRSLLPAMEEQAGEIGRHVDLPVRGIGIVVKSSTAKTTGCQSSSKILAGDAGVVLS
jgi:hypothetical protein